MLRNHNGNNKQLPGAGEHKIQDSLSRDSGSAPHPDKLWGLVYHCLCGEVKVWPALPTASADILRIKYNCNGKTAIGICSNGAPEISAELYFAPQDSESVLA